MQDGTNKSTIEETPIQQSPVTQPTQPHVQTVQEALDAFNPDDKNKALLILVNAAKVAQSKGIFSLEEAELISRAIRAFVVLPGDGPKPTSQA